MSKTPIQKQEGLSQDDLDKMQPVTQKYHNVGDTTITKQIGLNVQKEHLNNLILKCLIDFDKEKAIISPNDKYANDNCLDRFSEQLSKAICEFIKGQNWSVTTLVKTDVNCDGWNGVIEGSITNTILNLNINCE